MAGVIDDNGVQWERCNGCGSWKRLDNLGYLQPTEQQPNGLDLCVDCVDTLIQTRIVKFKQIDPASSWVRSR